MIREQEYEEGEQTLLVIKECFVYKIPPRTTAAGYKACDWGLSSPLWTGRLAVIAKGDNCVIRLETVNGELFANCPLNTQNAQQVVEGVSDSSRYFVLRIEDGQGRHAFIGIGFTERSDAFDFNVALQDFEKHVKQRRDAGKAAQRLAEGPKVDFSLKQNQVIHVNLKTKHGAIGAGESKITEAAPRNDFGGGTIAPLLPPPPASNRKGHGHGAAPVNIGSMPSQGVLQNPQYGGFQQQQQSQQMGFGGQGFGQPSAQQGGFSSSDWGDFQASPAPAAAAPSGGMNQQAFFNFPGGPAQQQQQQQQQPAQAYGGGFGGGNQQAFPQQPQQQQQQPQGFGGQGGPAQFNFGGMVAAGPPTSTAAPKGSNVLILSAGPSSSSSSVPQAQQQQQMFPSQPGAQQGPPRSPVMQHNPPAPPSPQMQQHNQFQAQSMPQQPQPGQQQQAFGGFGGQPQQQQQQQPQQPPTKVQPYSF